MAYVLIGLAVVLLAILVVIIHALFTNPFYRRTNVKTTYRAYFEGDKIVSSNQFDKV